MLGESIYKQDKTTHSDESVNDNYKLQFTVGSHSSLGTACKVYTKATGPVQRNFPVQNNLANFKMTVFLMPCDPPPSYCVHQSTPKVKCIQSYSQRPPVGGKRQTKLKTEKVEVNDGLTLSNKDVDGEISNKDSFLNTNKNGSVEVVEGERVKEIKKRINNLRECDNLLMNHIRKLFDTSYRPTKEDLAYLQQLFEADQQNVQNLGESLTNAKRAIHFSSYSSEDSIESNQTLPTSCAHPCIRQWEERDYSAIRAPSPSLLPPVPAGIRTCTYSHSQLFYLKQIQHLQKQLGSYKGSNDNGKCCRRVLGRCAHDTEHNQSGDLLRMENELRDMNKRIAKLADAPSSNPLNEPCLNCSTWSIISVVEEDMNRSTTDACEKIKCKKNGKCSCEASGKPGKRVRCIIL